MSDVILSYLHEDNLSELFVLLNKYRYRVDFMESVKSHIFCISAKLLEAMEEATVTTSEDMVSFLTFFYRSLTGGYSPSDSVSFSDILALGEEETQTCTNKKTKTTTIYPKAFRDIFDRKFSRQFTCYDSYLELNSGFPEPDSEYPNFLLEFALDYLAEENYEKWFYIVISTLRSSAFVQMKLAILHYFFEEFEIRGYVTKKFGEVCFSWYSEDTTRKEFIPLSTFIRDFVTLPRNILIKKYQIPAYHQLQGGKKFIEAE